VDGREALVLICAAASGIWLLLALGVLVGRVRGRHRRFAAPVPADEDWQILDGRVDATGPGRAGEGDDDARTLLERGLRSDEPDVRVASITALGRLGHRHEWAVDGLIEALAECVESPVRVVAQLDRLAPRPGRRLLPLLGHPEAVVRFYAVRLLVRYPSLAHAHVPDLTRDRSPNVRAAALETLRAVASGEGLRCALQLLEDPHPLVRAHATRSAAAIAGPTSAQFLVPLLADESWWVREAVRGSLVATGKAVADAVLPALESANPMLRSGAALVLQDVGFVDSLAGPGGDPHRLERILEAGGSRLRAAAAERASRGLVLGPPPGGSLEAAW
jgi:HEAT repeat protein